ncbi:hypothetical protein ACFL6T_02925 [Candidatus Zixiibacteriota bacterium]
MSNPITDSCGYVKIYGEGSPGGKGTGLVLINECLIPEAEKIPTRILSTSFYDRFIEQEGRIDPGDEKIIQAIVEELGETPIGVRSSATNEAGGLEGGQDQLHAGEYRSFMLSNNHPDPAFRYKQVRQAITHIYTDFIARQTQASTEKMAILINPIPGIFDESNAGPCYYPCVSGVASSYFPYALKTQDPNGGFARIAFGHGYATILDDFPIISMATIREPVPLKMMQSGNRQQRFYALNMDRCVDLSGDELETMEVLHTRFASQRLLNLLGVENHRVTMENLIQEDHFEFRTRLTAIMDAIKARITPHFQIEFVFNFDLSDPQVESGTFHIVQLTLLPELRRDAIQIPVEAGRLMLNIANSQGHGVIDGIRNAVVVSPFTYSRDCHDEVRAGIGEINQRMKEVGERYILVVPGRLGSTNREWGICLDYREVNQAAAIFEYGVDIAGRAEPLPEKGDKTGGIYGSHFLYMIQGGYNEDQKRMQTRMYGTQGTHFLTNLVADNIIYGFIAPDEDFIDPWFFSGIAPGEALAELAFPAPVKIFADSLNQFCKVIADHDG